MDVWEFLVLAICVVLAVVGVGGSLVIAWSQALADVPSLPGENVYWDPTLSEWHSFPDLPCALIHPGALDLSVVVPAYNEEARLGAMMEDCTEYLERRTRAEPAFGYEIIIVDDGSRDDTTRVGQTWSSRLGVDKVRVLKLARNRGKGGAVRMGMYRSRGRLCLFADADGASRFSDVAKLEARLSQIRSPEDHGIVCGSRAHLESDSIATRSLFRTVLMHGFHACVWLFGSKTVRDTQCGFKLMTRATASDLFRTLHIERWAFDVEMLKVAEMLGIPTGEVPVRWTEIDGSKLNPWLDSILMFFDLFALWLRYRLGAWRIAKRTKM